jgi:hypothetical protein
VAATLCIMYFLNYVDRNAIAQARINDIEEDLGMTGNDFNTAVSILFVGYVLMYALAILKFVGTLNL